MTMETEPRQAVLSVETLDCLLDLAYSRVEEYLDDMRSTRDFAEKCEIAELLGRYSSVHREVRSALEAAEHPTAAETVLANSDDNCCPNSPDGNHAVTSGSCDQCGAKNFG